MAIRAIITAVKRPLRVYADTSVFGGCFDSETAWTLVKKAWQAESLTTQGPQTIEFPWWGRRLRLPSAGIKPFFLQALLGYRSPRIYSPREVVTP